MQTAENKTKAEITAILQRHIYEGNIKHHIEPFTGKYIVADKIICEHRLVVAPNGKAADELQAIALIYCDVTSTTPDDDFWLWCRQRSADNHKVFILAAAAPTDFALIWCGRGKNIKLHTYGGTQWQK